MAQLPRCSRCTNPLRAGDWQQWACIGCDPQQEELDRGVLTRAGGKYWRVRCERCITTLAAEERAREEAIAESVLTARRTRDAITGILQELIAVRDELDGIIAAHAWDEAAQRYARAAGSGTT